MKKAYMYHKPSAAGLAKIAKLRKLFSDLDDAIAEICGAGRYAHLAITTNEQAAMWAIKAVVVDDPQSVVEVP